VLSQTKFSSFQSTKMTKGTGLISRIIEIRNWIAAYRWNWLWDFSPRGLLDAQALTSTARMILRLWEERTGTEIAALMVLEPYPALRTAFHLHALLQADDLDPNGFRAFSERWGQTRVAEYERGGGYIDYLAHKIARGSPLEIYGIPQKEGENADQT